MALPARARAARRAARRGRLRVRPGLRGRRRPSPVRPFAGTLGVALHSAGSVGKLWSEILEAADPAPLEAALSAGASRAKAAATVLVPETLPQTASSVLYVWEFNIRASTVLGVVGAGGLGQELKNAVDLLDFARVLAMLLVIVALVLAADRISAGLRRALL